jgi:hypothetical protein
MRENEHVPSNVPYPTRTGVKIGLLYRLPPPDTYRDGELLQRALLRPDDDPMEDLGRLAIGIVGIFFFAAVTLGIIFFL